VLLAGGRDFQGHVQDSLIELTPAG
jgi:hypothetical protein